MDDPQENVTIGNFLYSLGLCVGAKMGSSAPPAAVNLLQQTSYDGCLGDVMLTYPSVTRLLEFKRKGNHSKEARKHRIMRIAIDRTDHLATSLGVHWYLETAPAKTDFDFTFSARSYLDMFEQSQAPQSFKEFVDRLVDEATSDERKHSDEEVNAYIHDVMLTWMPEETKDHQRSATGMLISVAPSGGVRYAVLEDIADLGRTRKEILQMRELQRLEMRQALERGTALEREPPEHEHEHERSYTPSGRQREGPEYQPSGRGMR